MFGKRVKVVIVAVLIALLVSANAPLSGGASVVLAGECESSAGTCP